MNKKTNISLHQQKVKDSGVRKMYFFWINFEEISSSFCFSLVEEFRTFISKIISSDFMNRLFVALCDIGSAVFNYDMRRLNEILDVPKAWYKRGLMQRVFLGKEATFATSQSSTNQTKRSQSDSKQRTEAEDLGTPKLARKTGNVNMDSFFCIIFFTQSYIYVPLRNTRKLDIFLTFSRGYRNEMLGLILSMAFYKLLISYYRQKCAQSHEYIQWIRLWICYVLTTWTLLLLTANVHAILLLFVFSVFPRGAHGHILFQMHS